MGRSRVLLAVVALASVGSTAALATPPVGIVVAASHGRATVVEGGTIRAEKAKDMLFATYSIEPGASTGWHDDPGAVVVAVSRGALTLVEGAGCATKEYRAGQAVVVSPGLHLLKNAQEEPLEVFTAHVSLPLHGPTPYVEGETGGPACATRSGRVSAQGLARGDFLPKGHGDRHWGDGTRPLQIGKDLDVEVRDYILAPESSSGWHYHPGQAVGVVTKGVARSYECHDGQTSYIEGKTAGR